MLRARDVAARLAISLRQAYAIMRSVQHVQLGRSIRITEEALAEILEKAVRVPINAPGCGFRLVMPRERKPKAVAHDVGPRIRITQPGSRRGSAAEQSSIPDIVPRTKRRAVETPPTRRIRDIKPRTKPR